MYIPEEVDVLCEVAPHLLRKIRVRAAVAEQEVFVEQVANDTGQDRRGNPRTSGTRVGFESSAGLFHLIAAPGVGAEGQVSEVGKGGSSTRRPRKDAFPALAEYWVMLGPDLSSLPRLQAQCFVRVVKTSLVAVCFGDDAAAAAAAAKEKTAARGGGAAPHDCRNCVVVFQNCSYF